MSDYDSDDVPEAISFAQSKTEALEKFQEASKSIKEEKQKLKEKRKKRDEIFKAQKKEKLERFVIKVRVPIMVLRPFIYLTFRQQQYKGRM